MKFKKLIFAVACTSLFVGNVKADSTYIKVTNENNSNYSLSVNSLGFVQLKSPSGSDYYVLLTNSTSLPDISSSIVEESSGCKVNFSDNNAADNWVTVGTTGNVSNSEEWNYLEGYENAYVVKQYKKEGMNYCEVNSEPIKVKKQKIEMGKRYNSYVFDVTTENPHASSFSNYKGALSQQSWMIGDYNKKLKIGKIKDSDLINRLLSKKANLSELMTYAKNWY